jgi:hypothetical protein
LHIHAFLPGIDKSRGMLKASSRGFFRNIASRGVAPRGGGYGEVAIALAAPRQQSGAIYQGRGDSLHRSRRKDAFPGRDGQYRRKPSSRYYPSLCSFHILSLAAVVFLRAALAVPQTHPYFSIQCKPPQCCAYQFPQLRQVDCSHFRIETLRFLASQHQQADRHVGP